MSGGAETSKDYDGLAQSVRLLSLIIFAAQCVYLPWRFHSPIELGTFIFMPVLGSGLLLPLLLARKVRRGLNWGLVWALAIMIFGTIGIAEDTLSGKGSTAALQLLLIPPFQWLAVLICAAVGVSADHDRKARSSEADPHP